VSVDYAAQEVEAFRLVPHPPAGARGGVSSVEGQARRPVIEGGRIAVTTEEPLKRELEDFVAAVQTRRRPGVTGKEGRDALALATQVADVMAATLTETTHRGSEAPSL
jgi:predicted dehydrogenase